MAIYIIKNPLEIFHQVPKTSYKLDYSFFKEREKQYNESLISVNYCFFVSAGF